MFIKLGAEFRRPAIKSKIAQLLEISFNILGITPTHPLLVFALFRHLVPQVRQLGGELLDQCLSLIQLKL